ncbi:hemagglutinin repeat-containing protein, partial [Faucicola atlantae]|uniref:hemagglutinin repeat-containing protein n=1 Tax=Faucicola atlantae TaxID=34059 RepID=UPI000A613277
LVLDGAVVKGDYATGHIGGGIIAASRQDTAKYDGKNTNAGFSADIDLSKAGTGSNLSVNGGRTRANADYAAVTEQTGLQYRKSDMVVDGKSTFKGAYFTTATPEDNQTQFNGGLEVSDIQNHSQYKADGIGVGLSAGMNPTTNQMNPPGISGIGYGRDSDSQTSTTYGAVTGMAGKSDVTTANVGTLNETLVNSFDKDRVNAQINAQVSVTQAFDTERRSYRLEMAQKEQELRDKAKEAQKRGDIATHDALIAKADKQQHDRVLFDSITGAIYGSNSNGATGYVARAVAPEVSYQIGQYFKGTNGEGTAPHILAHGILAAAVSAATGNDVTTGALSAMGAEAAAPMVAKFLFGDKPISELSADEK